MMPHNLQTMRPSYDVDRPSYEETRMLLTVNRKACARCGTFCNCNVRGEGKCVSGTKNATAVTDK